MVEITFMKKPVSYIFLFLLLLAGNFSIAQNSIFAGKIVDEYNKPVPGARIKVSQAGNLLDEVLADKDGLYYTKLLPQGNYNIDIRANGKFIKAGKVHLKVTDNIKWYYNLRMTENKVEVIITAHDPFIQTKLSKLEEQPIFDYAGKRTMRVKFDVVTRNITSFQSIPDAPVGRMIYLKQKN